MAQKQRFNARTVTDFDAVNVQFRLLDAALRWAVYLDGFQNEISADRGDTSVTLDLLRDNGVQRFATALTANRTVTLPTANLFNGAAFRVVRTGLGAFTLDVGGLKTIPAATAAFVEVKCDGTSWRLVGYGLL